MFYQSGLGSDPNFYSHWVEGEQWYIMGQLQLHIHLYIFLGAFGTHLGKNPRHGICIGEEGNANVFDYSGKGSRGVRLYCTVSAPLVSVVIRNQQRIFQELLSGGRDIPIRIFTSRRCAL